MTVDNLLYLTGALFDMFGALLIVLGFYNISNEDIKRFSENRACSISKPRAESIIKQRFEAIFGGSFIVFGSLLMALATIFSYGSNEPKLIYDFLNTKVAGIEAYLPIIVVSIVFSISYWYVIPRMCKTQIKIIELK